MAVTSNSWWFCVGNGECLLGFSVCVCLLGTGKSSFFNNWCLLGREGKVDVSSDFVSPFCFHRTLNFYWLASFFPLHHQASRGCDPSTRLPPSRSDVSKNLHLRSHWLSVPSFHLPGAQAADLFSVFPYLGWEALSGGNFHLFCCQNQVWPPDSLFWKGFCYFQMFISLPVY